MTIEVGPAGRLAQGDTDDRLKPLIRAGASYRVTGPLSFAVDVSQDGEFRVGTEYAFGVTALRVGIASASRSAKAGADLSMIADWPILRFLAAA